jgi:hypothetical protein
VAVGRPFSLVGERRRCETTTSAAPTVRVARLQSQGTGAAARVMGSDGARVLGVDTMLVASGGTALVGAAVVVGAVVGVVVVVVVTTWQF